MTSLGGALFLVSSFGPGVAAFVTVWALEGRAGLACWVSQCLRWRLGWHWYALAVISAPLLMLAAIGLQVATGGTVPAATVQGSAMFFAAQFVVVTLLGGPLGEEFGWRGYALPALTERIGWRWAALCLGIVWGIWHLPLFWMPGTAQADLPMGLFLASTIALSIVLARLSVNTGFSVLPAILLHGAVNWSAMVLPVMPDGEDPRIYSIVMALLFVTAGIVILKPGPDWTAASRR
ncbi:MAG: CPBP family intramembrane glutamic endopeptidase [Pseudotabrizicola sp.]|uniref:CPBP family intramembrane glutamic endopeptidase n=1 Tax=Pseudotabrizicola sp. TaxID=2939647 RepID=UPI0027315E6C|nr:CPBP family intramembrane glutamic endopeptidase [Pseudotabrizicola sp.]MDP2079707.1 CPBP family intramembrane metalloprotease [Pseudotabrizicola sp.]MDZ7574242.1 CPBP family intramembrane glutamic endopeptidase [Pseudotabrizicola sp.]